MRKEALSAVMLLAGVTLGAAGWLAATPAVLGQG